MSIPLSPVPVGLPEYVSAVRKVLSDPRRLTAQAWARNSEGVPVDPVDPRACSFCLVGAFWRVSSRCRSLADFKSLPCVRKALMPLVGWGEPPGLESYADTLGHAAVMRLLDRYLEANPADEATADLLARKALVGIPEGVIL